MTVAYATGVRDVIPIRRIRMNSCALIHPHALALPRTHPHSHARTRTPTHTLAPTPTHTHTYHSHTSSRSTSFLSIRALRAFRTHVRQLFSAVTVRCDTDIAANSEGHAATTAATAAAACRQFFHELVHAACATDANDVHAVLRALPRNAVAMCMGELQPQTETHHKTHQPKPKRHLGYISAVAACDVAEFEPFSPDEADASAGADSVPAGRRSTAVRRCARAAKRTDARADCFAGWCFFFLGVTHTSLDERLCGVTWWRDVAPSVYVLCAFSHFVCCIFVSCACLHAHFYVSAHSHRNRALLWRLALALELVHCATCVPHVACSVVPTHSSVADRTRRACVLCIVHALAPSRSAVRPFTLARAFVLRSQIAAQARRARGRDPAANSACAAARGNASCGPHVRHCVSRAEE